MKNTIVALYGRQNEGKSETIKNVCRLIITEFSNATLISPKTGIEYSSDILVVFEIGNIKIGIESQGDPNSRMFTTIENLAKENCNIILCATRTKSETVNKVDEIANRFDYYTLWLSSFWSPQQISEPLNRDLLNRLAAENIIEIIRSLIDDRF